MKKLITICLLLATTFTLNAQDFEASKYQINEILKQNKITYLIGGVDEGETRINLKKIEVKEFGKVIINGTAEKNAVYFQLFDITGYELKEGSLLLIDEDRKMAKIMGLSRSSGKEIIKSLRNLYVLCVKNQNVMAGQMGYAEMKADKWESL